ncbi:MAG: gamma carbonic anhydrase family protein [Proteobacteria bacterium]|nr:gamma carbonic anhydrase family protein [Pseudomonadota bacterium]MBU4469566.1 gamma carbonic anhydrase family protein [Pseudomonadota bacterium]MCG2753244.1 gamma carbonic anhydrase family protein [Desulfobacteraceae bacterium]
MIFSYKGKEPRVGKGTYVSDTARIIGDVIIGENCYIGHGAIIRADYGKVEIGSGTAVQEGAIISSPLENICIIEDFVTIAYGAVVHSKAIGKHSVVGIGAILGIDSRIGEWTIVAEGAVVRMRQIVPNNMVVGGNPAHTIREATPKDHENWLKVKELYNDLAENYLKGAMKPMPRT